MASDIDIVRGAYASFAEGDIPAVLQVMAPEVEWVAPTGYPHGGVYRGHEEVVTLFQKAAEASGRDWRVETDRFVAIEGGVLVLGRHTGTTPDGSPWEVPFAMVFTMRDGKLTHFQEYGDSALYREVAEANA